MRAYATPLSPLHPPRTRRKHSHRILIATRSPYLFLWCVENKTARQYSSGEPSNSLAEQSIKHLCRFVEKIRATGRNEVSPRQVMRFGVMKSNQVTAYFQTFLLWIRKRSQKLKNQLHSANFCALCQPHNLHLPFSGKTETEISVCWISDFSVLSVLTLSLRTLHHQPPPTQPNSQHGASPLPAPTQHVSCCSAFPPSTEAPPLLCGATGSPPFIDFVA